MQSLPMPTLIMAFKNPIFFPEKVGEWCYTCPTLSNAHLTCLYPAYDREYWCKVLELVNWQRRNNQWISLTMMEASSKLENVGTKYRPIWRSWLQLGHVGWSGSNTVIGRSTRADWWNRPTTQIGKGIFRPIPGHVWSYKTCRIDYVIYR